MQYWLYYLAMALSVVGMVVGYLITKRKVAMGKPVVYPLGVFGWLSFLYLILALATIRLGDNSEKDWLRDYAVAEICAEQLNDSTRTLDGYVVESFVEKIESANYIVYFSGRYIDHPYLGVFCSERMARLPKIEVRRGSAINNVE